MNSSIFNFSQYPKALMAALLAVFITILSGACFLKLTDNMPAPMFSNNLSLDEKFRFLRINKRLQADYIVLGSSTGLNNVPSEAMLEHPKINGNYLNYSAWGLNMEGHLYYWNFIKEIVRPRVVIIPIDVGGFNNWEDKIPDFNYPDVKRYLNGASPLWYYFKYHKSALGERIGLVLRHRKMNDTQVSLKFDRAGGVPIHVAEESEITRKKWKDEVDAKRYTESAYEGLDKLLASLKQNGIIAVVAQQPLREHYKEGEPGLGLIKDHWDRVSVIAEQNGAYFFNMQDILPEDPGLFSDSSHLNEWAAKEFVKELLRRMEREGIFEKAGSLDPVQLSTAR